MTRLNQAWVDCVGQNGGTVTTASDGMTSIHETDQTRKACAREWDAVQAYTETPEYKSGLVATRASIEIGWQCVADSGYIVEEFESHSDSPPRPSSNSDPIYLDVAARCGIPSMGATG